jgi:hypothetical protein
MREHKNYPALKALLTQAFKAIRREQIVARQNFSCCGGCACAELGEMLKQRTNQRGAVYYHQQDNYALRSSGEVYLGFGARPETPADEDGEAAEAIGRSVVNVLEAHGLAVTWDGSHRQRILVSLPLEN